MKLAQVEEHFEALDLNEMAPGGALHFSPADVTTKAGDVIGKVCGIYQKVRPFLSLASELFLVPAKWRAALKSYMALMDGLCPNG